MPSKKRATPVSLQPLEMCIRDRSYRFKAREKNAGWRIDYFCTSKALESRLEDAKILTNVFGSDHCPVELDFK